jgi:hypothetical protein
VQGEHHDDAGREDLARFLLLAWPLTVAVLVLPRLVALRGEADWERYLPLLIGLGVSALVLTLAALLIGRLNQEGRVQRSWLFRALPGVAWGYLPPASYSLHAVALVLGLASQRLALWRWGRRRSHPPAVDQVADEQDLCEKQPHAQADGELRGDGLVPEQVVQSEVSAEAAPGDHPEEEDL